MVFSSKYIEDAVAAFAQLPGIGKKTALRLVLHLLKQEDLSVQQFTQRINTMKENTLFCKQCHNISDSELCSICTNSSRNTHQICVVETIRDVIAIESTQQYHGLYHVLGGILSPLDGVGPDQINVQSLIDRAHQNKELKEIIMALSPNLEGDTTAYYISKNLKELDLQITTIARGISFGGELEYADEITLARSISKRLPIDNYVQVSK